MIFFHYTALTTHGSLIKGDSFSKDPYSLSKELQERQLTPLSIKKYSQRILKRISQKDFADLFLKIALLLDAGHTLHRTCTTLIQSTPSTPLQIFLKQVIYKLEHGQDLESIFCDYPDIFPPLVFYSIKMGQASGNLSKAFHHLHTTLLTTLEEKQKIRRLMVYPLLLVTMMSLMIALFMEYLLPQILEHLNHMGTKELPLTTQLLIYFSHVLSTYSTFFLAPFFLIFVTILLFPLSPLFQNRVTPLLFKVPWVGYFMKQHYAQKWLLMVGQLYKVGVDFKNCLLQAELSESNPFIRNSFKIIRESAEHGDGFTKIIEDSRLFSPVVISLCDLALHNGTLAESLLTAYSFERKDSQSRLERMIKFLEPFLLILMGAMLLWIVLAVISPLYDFQNLL